MHHPGGVRGDGEDLPDPPPCSMARVGENEFDPGGPDGLRGQSVGQKTGYPAGTIHRSIYAMDKLLTRRDGTDGFKYFYGLKLVAQCASSQRVRPD